MSSLEEAERVSAEGATAPRVSVKSMEDKIESVYFVNAGRAILEVGAVAEIDPAVAQPLFLRDHPTYLMTLAFVTMQNGFVLVGKSAPAHAENYDEAKGKAFAYEDAIRQLWPMEGYLLRHLLWAAELDHEVREALADHPEAI